MKRGRIGIFLVIPLLFLSPLVMANGLNLNSLGSRALAMGGAFVGLADDYSTIFWNPAGIAHFEKEYFGFSGDDIIPYGSYEVNFNHPFFGSTTVNAETISKHYLAGMAAYYRPLSENLVAGIGVYTPSGLGAEWEGDDFAPLSFGQSYNWKSRIGVVTVSPVLGYKVNDLLYVGGSLNVNYGMFDISTHAGGEAIVDPTTGQLIMTLDFGQQKMNLSGWGYGATLGVLVKPSEKFSLGATFKTPTKIQFSGDAEISNLNILTKIPGSPFYGATISNSSKVEGEVTWPMWIAGGIAFSPVEELTITADVQYTNWKKIDVIEFDYTDVNWELIMEATEGNKMPMHWRNATQIRFGAEYRINNVALRGGYYWDPSPAPDKTMNVLVPNYDFNVITLGLGYSLDGLQLDFGVEYLMGEERNIPVGKTQEWHPEYDSEWGHAMPGNYKQKILAPSVSVSYTW